MQAPPFYYEARVRAYRGFEELVYKSERAIGWWLKERYRTMRGYKRPESAVNVSRLLAWCGNHLNCGGADLSLLFA